MDHKREILAVGLRVSPMFKSKEGHKLGPISFLMVNQNHHNV
jgi:hypothetical protein